MRVFDGVLVKTTPATMAVIEELNEMTDFIQYRISDEYVLCKPNSTTTLEVNLHGTKLSSRKDQSQAEEARSLRKSASQLAKLEQEQLNSLNLQAANSDNMQALQTIHTVQNSGAPPAGGSENTPQNQATLPQADSTSASAASVLPAALPSAAAEPALPSSGVSLPSAEAGSPSADSASGKP
ncbi:REX1 DNA repair protein [Gregarina niphandrodes]|uniref:General transcription and DNA repair factor IIH subunit TFB5 n=1 Tax=Gregarina niphandrodes TaxID=110365 RepID=A0A023BC91_GRENI|nr:REX1 DNA repair protein [Gregarina niphandrodes]EZG83076.1 REX1 DNA repair protein [Gregarina niphandrodes]|eukprot:XP_011128957.1 REX1 DNA repair protein [Gregarina niphandrodes]